MNHKLLVFRSIFLLGSAALLIAACTSAKPSPQPTENDGSIRICHANGKTDVPYDALTLELTQLSQHSKHPNDIVPAPAEGCPKTLQNNINKGKMSICHANNSIKKPYNEIIVAFSGLNGHADHKWDIIPAPQNGCPGLPTPTITKTPTITQTPPMSKTPTITRTPISTKTLAPTVVGAKDGKITICHTTGNGKKGGGYVMITISVNGLSGHSKHAEDIIPAPAGGCPNE